MKLVIQRVNHANVKIDSEEVGKINKGLLVLVGVAADDDEKIVEKYFNKLIKLRIFEDENGKTNLSFKDVGFYLYHSLHCLQTAKRETDQAL